MEVLVSDAGCNVHNLVNCVHQVKVPTSKNNNNAGRGKVPQNKSSNNRKRNNKPIGNSRQREPNIFLSPLESKTLEQLKKARSFYDPAVEKLNGAELRRLASAVIKQDSFYVFPRPIATSVFSKRVQVLRGIKLSQAEIAAGARIAVMVRPDPEHIMTIFQQQPSHLTELTVDSFGSSEVLGDIDQYDYSIRVPIKTELGEIHTVYNPALPGFCLEQRDGRNLLSPGAILTPVNGISGTQPNITIELGSNTNDPTIKAQVRFYDKDFNIISTGDSGATVVSENGATITLTGATVSYVNAWTTAVGSNTAYIQFLLKQTTSTINMAGQLKGTIQVNAFTVAGSLTGQQLSLWDMLPQNASIKSLYNGATNVSITGMNTLFQNGSANLLRGGLMRAARLPGGSEGRLPGTWQGITDLVTSVTHHTLSDANINLGAFWVYTPEKAQDIWFYPPRTPSTRPFGMLVAEPTAAMEAEFILNVVINITFELISTDISLNYIRSVSSDGLTSSLLSALSTIDGWSHNPNHVQAMARMVKQVVSHPEVKIALKSMLMAGVKLAPMVISALV